MDEIAWEARLIGIRGARGVGKTTLLLQYIKKGLPFDGSTLYVSLDNIWFAEHKLVDLVDDFVKRGGKFLFLDEVHRNTNWSRELKNIYDNADKGNIRETFFINQVGNRHDVEYIDKGDFLVNRKFTFEVGGKNKTNQQIHDIQKGFVVADDIEYGYGDKIPLWLFGFLY